MCRYIFEAAATCALKLQLVGSGFQLTCEYPYVFIHFQNGKTMISIEFVAPRLQFQWLQRHKGVPTILID